MLQIRIKAIELYPPFAKSKFIYFFIAVLYNIHPIVAKNITPKR